jgi:hypothetical protein
LPFNVKELSATYLVNRIGHNALPLSEEHSMLCPLRTLVVLVWLSFLGTNQGIRDVGTKCPTAPNEPKKKLTPRNLPKRPTITAAYLKVHGFKFDKKKEWFVRKNTTLKDFCRIMGCKPSECYIPRGGPILGGRLPQKVILFTPVHGKDIDCSIVFPDHRKVITDSDKGPPYKLNAVGEAHVIFRTPPPQTESCPPGRNCGAGLARNQCRKSPLKGSPGLKRSPGLGVAAPNVHRPFYSESPTPARSGLDVSLYACHLRSVNGDPAPGAGYGGP